MKTNFPPIVFACILLMGCGVVRMSSSPMLIKIPEASRQENFTNDQLKTFLKQSESPSILVRNLSVTGTDVASNANTARIVAILESGLTRNGFDVRDRSLFNSVIQSASTNQSVDYQKLYEQTQVDLLFEVSGYSINDLYKVDGYWLDDRFLYFPTQERLVDGRKQKYRPSYLFRGMSIEIKVIILKDNLMGGVYSYSYVPCAEELGGARIIQLQPLRYSPFIGARDIDAVMDDDGNSSLLQSRGERLDQAMENYITTTVIPKIMADMKGTIYESPQPYIAQTAPRVQENKPEEPEQRSRFTITNRFQPQRREQTSSESTPVVTTPLVVGETINSFEKLAPAVKNLISQRYVQQVGAKKANKKSLTDLEKMEELKSEYQKEINQFIITSVSPVGKSPTEEGVIFLVPPQTEYPVTSDYGLLFFVDGECLGTGTSAKGMFSQLAIDHFSSGIHTVIITTARGRVLFESSVDFSIKDKFFFSQNQGGRIVLAS